MKIGRLFVASLFFILLAVASCGQEKRKEEKIETLVRFDNPNLTLDGRIGKKDTTNAQLFWAGSSVTIKFNGTGVNALLKDEKGKNYYNVVIDGDSVIMLRVDSTKRLYQIAKNLPKGEHTVQLFKRTEWFNGKTDFFGFKLPKNSQLTQHKDKRKRMIEFYGNSITAGYAVEDLKGDCPDSIYTNNYRSYAAITARHFNAKYSCIARSGIGIMVSWYPIIMPELYNRLDPTDPQSKWDFKKASPDVVVINLFQNDSWLIHRPRNEEFKKRLGKKPSKEYIIESYRKFVATIRKT